MVATGTAGITTPRTTSRPVTAPAHGYDRAMRSRVVACLAVLAASPVCTAVAAGPSPTSTGAPQPIPALRQGVDEVEPSIVLVTQEISGSLHDSGDGKTHGPFSNSFAGTGFFVSADGYLVTASHVASPTAGEQNDELVDAYIDQLYNCDPASASDGCQSVEDAHHDEIAQRTTPQDVSVSIHVLTQDRSPDDDGVAATVVAHSPSTEYDVSVLKIEGRNEPVAVLADPAAVKPLIPVAVIGYPQSADAAGPTLVPTVTSGEVNSVHRANPGDIAAAAELVQVDARVEDGNSGGPGVAEDGSVLGIVSFGTSDSVNYLVSAHDVQGVLAQTPAHDQLGTIDNDWRSGLAAMAAHDYATAAAAFDACFALNSTVIDCRNRSADAHRLAPAGSSPRATGSASVLATAQSGFVPGLIVGGLAGLVLAAAVLLIRRQPRQRPPPPPPPPPSTGA